MRKLVSVLMFLGSSIAVALPSASSFVTNEDGSVTINHPRFLYNGNDTPIFLSINPDFPGACRLFKFDRMVAHTTIEIQTRGTKAVVLDTAGRIKGVRVKRGNNDSFDRFEVYESVTCQK